MAVTIYHELAYARLKTNAAMKLKNAAQIIA
jgi:hypothetical protein